MNKMKVSVRDKNTIVPVLSQAFVIALSTENLGAHYF